MGEKIFQKTAVAKAVQTSLAVQSQQSGDLRVATPGGVLHMHWDENARNGMEVCNAF